MFSHLTRGYGTWQGIAKLEKAESAISGGVRSGADFVLPPINQDGGPAASFEQPTKYVYPYHHHHHAPPDDHLRLPNMYPREEDAITIPKTYTTKSGALLLYTEGCFVPGSRRLKKRPRLRARKEKIRLHTLKDLSNLIIDYKKNECDPLLLEHLWRNATFSGRDLRPGFSPQRYLGTLLESTSLDEEAWQKLLDSGSLRSFGGADKGFLPALLVRDGHVKDLLHQRPQPYTTMSLPPVSPSSSMLGSFTFYKQAMSTGAASMVSSSSVDEDEGYYATTAHPYIDTLSERLSEVESNAGFKQSYESLSPKEKEDLLTQLLMDVTLHNAGELSHADMPHNTPECSSAPLTMSSMLNESLSSNNSKSDEKSKDSARSLSNSMKSAGSKHSTHSSVCSLPPIMPKESNTGTMVVDGTSAGDLRGDEEQFDLRSSSSGSGLGITRDGDYTVELAGIDIEMTGDSINLEESEKAVLSRKESHETISSGTTSQCTLVEALEIQDGDSVHACDGDEVWSLKSLDLGYLKKDGGEGVLALNGSDGIGGGDGESSVVVGDGDGGDAKNDAVIGDSDHDGIVGESGADGSGVENGTNVGDGEILITGPSDDIPDGIQDERTNAEDQASGQNGLQVPHISLSSLHDEVKMVAEEVLARPKSGRSLEDDAKAATALLIGRIETLLGPVMATDNIRVSSASPRRLRPLGQPRNSELGKNLTTLPKIERTKSAGPSFASKTSSKTSKLTTETTPQIQNEEKAAINEDAVNSVPADEAQPETTASMKSVEEITQEEIKLDDIILNTDDDVKVKELPTPDKAEAIAESPAPEPELLTVKDLKSTEQQAATSEIQEPKSTKGGKNVKKAGKGKKGAKKGNIAKGKGKRKAKAQPASPERPKTPPFRAGVVPPPKPPKGLEVKADEEKVAHEGGKTPDLQARKSDSEQSPIEPKPEIVASPDEVKEEMRVDSETGEAENRAATPASVSVSSKTPSTLGVPSSLEDSHSSLMSKTPSSRLSTTSSRNETISHAETTRSEKTDITSRDKTPPPRETTPTSPRDATPREELSPEAAGDSGGGEPAEEVPEPVSGRNKKANARAAQRAAAAERRRQEVERKRKEREEARRQAIEEEARLEQLRLEAEEEMKHREEQRKVEREHEEQERCCREAEERERAQKERAVLERQKRAKDEWSRKKDQLVAQRKMDEEMRLEQEQLEREMAEQHQREYAERIAHLAVEEQERLLEERRLQEERIKREVEEERLRREEERQRVLEERRRMAEELETMRQRQQERQLFLESLWKEYQDILLGQRTSRAFTFSYFDYMPWLRERFSDSPDERPTTSDPVQNVLGSPDETEEVTWDITP